MNKPKLLDCSGSAIFMLPDGTTTFYENVYVKAWRDFAKPIGNVIGGKLMGFDPGLSFNVQGRRVDFDDTESIHKINEAIK